MTDIDATTAAVDRQGLSCPLCRSNMDANPLSYALHGTQGYRAKCRRCGSTIVMAWAPLARAVRKLGIVR